MPVKKQPESASVPIPADALDWFQQFLKHLEVYFVDACQRLPNESDVADYRKETARLSDAAVSDWSLDLGQIHGFGGELVTESLVRS